MTTMLSPQSTCGVKFARCLPLRRSARKLARRPRMTPSASTRIHFLAFAAETGFSDWVVDIFGGPSQKARNIGFQALQVNAYNAFRISILRLKYYDTADLKACITAITCQGRSLP